MAHNKVEIANKVVEFLNAIMFENGGYYREGEGLSSDINTMGENLEYHLGNVSAHYVLAEEPEDHSVIGYGILQEPEFVRDNFGIECSPGDTIIMVQFFQKRSHNGETEPVIGAYVCDMKGVRNAWMIPFQGNLREGCSPWPEYTIQIWQRLK